ncbi:zinc carboxypeptidase A 1-like [Zerene cesonia]|uniref:zinc carboxypeptidase A 1-like n=1 Tax=Zerene cesonia TaxID=33412 RepID=UPI0018E58273|nr:zinc carboxypeptidase A 1-like [Zerene cesonia]
MVLFYPHFTNSCKSLRSCYADMLDKLLDVEEDACIENVAIGASTVTIFLKALKQFCGDVIDVRSDALTYENRILYEVVLNSSNEVDTSEAKPVIMLEAGQRAGSQSVMLALYVIEQLVACEEYEDMLEKVAWVILPSTNPDGQEYVRCKREEWNKNMFPLQETFTFGVDISRNFDDSWSSCRSTENIFSSEYPGPGPASENETIFISSVIAKYKPNLKAYLSIRRDGHSILYPFASISSSPASPVQIKAGEIAAKVNQRSGTLQWFANMSIYEMNGKPWCGHSVDYAYNKHGIAYSFEMRVFPESDNTIMSKFQSLPKGYDASLRNGYFTGIRELYNTVVSEKTTQRNLIK